MQFNLIMRKMVGCRAFDTFHQAHRLAKNP